MPATDHKAGQVAATAGPNPPRNPDKLLFAQHEAWPFVGVSRSEWYRLKALGELPKPVATPGSSRPMWRAADLRKWVERLKPARMKRAKAIVPAD